MGVKRNPSVTDQIFSLLWIRIRDGEYVPGERLPSESELAEEFGVSRASLRTAMAKMEAAGLIERKHGDGTYVVERDLESNSLIHAIWEFTHLIEDSGRTPSIECVLMEERQATAEEAEALGLKPIDKVLSLERLFFADEDPIILSRNISPAIIFKEGIENLDATLPIHEFLKVYSDQRIDYANAEISAVLADEKVEEHLGAEINAPILLIREIFFNAEDEPIVFAVNYYNDKDLSLHEIRSWH